MHHKYWKSRLDGLAPLEGGVWRNRGDVEQNFARAQKAFEHAGSMFSILTSAFNEKVMENEAVRIPKRCVDAALLCPSYFHVTSLLMPATQFELTGLSL